MLKFGKFIKVGIAENVAVLILLGQSMVLARMMNAETMGRYSLLIAILSLGAQFVSLGIPTAISVFSASNPQKQPIYVSTGVGVLAVSSVIIGGILGGFIGFSPTVRWLEMFPLYGVVLSVVAYFFIVNIRAIVRNLANIEKSYSTLFVLPLGGALAQVAVLPFALGQSQDHILVVALMGFFLAALVRMLIPLRFLSGRLSLLYLNITSGLELLKRSWRYNFNDLLFIASTQIGILILGWVGEYHEAGLYSRAAQFSNILNTACQGILPLLFTKWIFEKKSDVKVQLFQSAKYIFAIGLLFVILVWFFAEKIMGALYGGGYIEGADALRYLTFAGVSSIVSRIIFQALNSTGNEKFITWGLVVTVPGTCVLFFAISRVGSYGFSAAETMACSMAISSGILMVVSAIFFKRTK